MHRLLRLSKISKERIQAMDKTIKAIPSLFMSIIELIIGILLLINPIGFTSGIIICAGVVLSIMGISSLIKYFRDEPEEAAKTHNFSKGTMILILGIFCMFKSEWFITTFPLLTIIYGIFTLITGITKLQGAIDMKRANNKYWYVALISAILTLICAIFIVANPFTTTAVLWTFIAVTLIIEAVMDILTFAFAKK